MTTASHQRVEALVVERNTQQRMIHWPFTAQEAHIKLYGLSQSPNQWGLSTGSIDC